MPARGLLLITFCWVILAAAVVLAKYNGDLLPGAVHTNGLNGHSSVVSLPEYLTLDKVAFGILFAITAGVLLAKKRGTGIFLVDLHCFKVPENLKVRPDQIIEQFRIHKSHPEDQIAFQEYVMKVSGMGEKCGISNGIIALKDRVKYDKTYGDSMEESEMILFDVVENLMRKTGIKAHEVDIVAVSCSCFAPTPSMAAMLVNRCKFKESVLTYNLSGMGCSSSLICVDMVKHLLKANPNKLALVVNHENITNCYYTGSERSFQVCNCLFRLGGAAVFMSNRPKDRRRAKYELLTTVRTHTGSDDDSFSCMGLGEDKDGILGVFLRKNVVAVAGRAMSKNIAALGRLILPYSEMARYAMDNKYVPNFKTCIEHFLLHTGGRAVLDDLEKTLKLNEKDMVPSRAALSRFGNTSAASTWYILSHIEHYGTMRKGDRIWQLGFGGGFKCNSAVWRARRSVRQSHSCWLDD